MRISSRLKNTLQLLALTLITMTTFEVSEAGTLALNSISASPSAAVSGQWVTATIRMSDKCPSAGCLIALKSSNPLAPIPSSLTILKDRTSGSVTFKAGNVSSATSISLSATWGGRTVQSSMSINPVGLKSVSFAQTSGYEGTSGTINVSLNGACQISSCIVNLVSSHPLLVSVPSSVAIANGQMTSSIKFYAGKPSVSPTAVSVTASYNGKSMSANYSVLALAPSPTPTPPPSGPYYSVSAFGEANLSVGTVYTDTYGYSQALRNLNGVNPIDTNIMAAYKSCLATYPGLGQLEPVGGVVQLPITSDGYSKWYRVRQDFYCKAGPYSGWTNSFTANMYVVPGMYGYMRIGNTSAAEVCLTQAAPTGGAVIELTSTSTAASIPSSIMIPAGTLCGQFSITAKASAGTVTIRAKLNGFFREVMFEGFY